MINQNPQPTTYHPASSVGRLQPSPHNLKPNQGFVMLFSVLVSSLLVVIGLSIFNLTLKEITLSTAGRESQIAFYAANSGLECALYWDTKGNGSRSAFASTTVDVEVASAKTVSANCNGVTVNDVTPSSVVATDGKTTTTSTAKTAVQVQGSDSNGSCFDITVSKITNTTDKKMTTVIVSQGTNTCVSGGRKVQRGLQASYESTTI